MTNLSSMFMSLKSLVSGFAVIALFSGVALYSGLPGFASAVRATTSPAVERGREGFRCSDHTLRGRYAVRGDGWVPNGPPTVPMVPFANVSLMTLDGEGGLVNDVTVSRNGQISRNVDLGTYTVDENCKGTMTINIPAPPFQLNFDLVVSDAGKEFVFIATTPSVVTHEAKRLQ